MSGARSNTITIDHVVNRGTEYSSFTVSKTVLIKLLKIKKDPLTSCSCWMKYVYFKFSLVICPASWIKCQVIKRCKNSSLWSFCLGCSILYFARETFNYFPQATTIKKTSFQTISVVSDWKQAVNIWLFTFRTTNVSSRNRLTRLNQYFLLVRFC